MTWLGYALISAIAAAATAVLAKLGVDGVSSTLATAIRTVVVAVLAWAIVFGAGELRSVGEISRRTWFYLAMSGVATGVSWLAYFRALQIAPVSMVSPIDKLSLPFTIVLAAFFLREPITWQVLMGVALIVIGAIVTQLR
jgi:transporter family protein